MSEEFDDGLRRARAHLGRAAIEALEAARVLLETALRAGGLDSLSPESLAGEIGRSLDTLISALREGRPLRLPPALAGPLFRALDGEILRWEERSKTDPDARPVVRAFLGLREILWELGIRAPAPSARPPADRGEPADGGEQTPREPTRTRRAPETGPRTTRDPRRVQRFDIES